jgi:hypothetical protein
MVATYLEDLVMKKHVILVSAVALIGVFLLTGASLAAPQQGLLVDLYGTPVKGYSNVYVVDGKAYPVYNSETHLWYTVFVTGTAEDGTPLCTLGNPMGVDSSADEWEDGPTPAEHAAMDDDVIN